CHPERLTPLLSSRAQRGIYSTCSESPVGTGCSMDLLRVTGSAREQTPRRGACPDRRMRAGVTRADSSSLRSSESHESEGAPRNDSGRKSRALLQAVSCQLSHYFG